MKIAPLRHARYLEIALAQRERALNKALSEYGADSPICVQYRTDIKELRDAIDELKQPQLPIEPPAKR